MLQVSSLVNKVFDGLFYPFQTLSPFWVLTIVSLLTAIVMLLIFRRVSNQTGIRQTKNLIKAHFLEIPIFRHDLRSIFQAQGRIMRYNLTYMKYAVMPMLVMILPIVLILIQLNLRLGYLPLEPGQSTIVSIKLEEGTLRKDFHNSMALNPSLVLHTSKGVEVETPPLRIIDEDEVDWRIRAKRAGKYDLVFHMGEEKFKKMVRVTERIGGFAPLTDRASFLGQFLNPVEPPLPGNGVIESIKVNYAARNFSIYGWNIHWIILYFALSIIFAFALKGVFGVEV
jgi:uncharacterized membrane protein (DUF106 family)